MKRAVITGIGVRCAIANNVTELTSYLRGYSFSEADQTTNVITRKNIKQVIEKNLDDVRENKFKSFSDFAMSSFIDALNDSGLSKESLLDIQEQIAVVYSTTTEDVETKLGHAVLGQVNKNPGNRKKTLAEVINEQVPFKGNLMISNSSCAAGGIAVATGLDEIRFGHSKVVFVGGIELTSLIQYTGFEILGALCLAGANPFSQDRDGVALGDASVFLVVEELEYAQARDARIYGEIIGYGLSNDAYHPTATHPEGIGAKLAMRKAISCTGVDKNLIGYINAHGTGTPSNDLVEYQAIGEVFNSTPELYVSSTKSVTGHTLAAAGVLECAVTLLALANEFVIPNFGLKNPVVNTHPGIVLPTDNIDKSIQYAMSNSFAFGGNCVSLLLSKY